MLFLKGPRGLVLTCVVLIFVTVYYCYLRLDIPPKVHKSRPVTPQDVVVDTEWPTDGKLKPSKSLEKELYPSISHHSHPSPTPTFRPDLKVEHSSSAPSATLLPSDILLIIKTGASTSWRRMPIQLITTLSNLPNRVIYSDFQENLSHEIQTVDVLSNVSDIIRTHDTTAYGIYQELQSNILEYREQAQLPGDAPEPQPGNTPGWVLDRYKFLPMLEHAQKNYPGFKWTVYIEDDTFVFWTNLLRWLATLQADGELSYYGAHSGEGNATFAQGGSGVVFSRSLMTAVFSGPKIPTLKDYANFTADACCGDMILGKVLRDYGVLVNQGEFGPTSFRPEPPWKTKFEEYLWCKPTFTFHHLHQRDLVQLTNLERKHNQSNLGLRPLLFRDIFLPMIYPYLKDHQNNWDNFASRHKLTENITTLTSASWEPPPPIFQDKIVLEQAYSSPDACLAACLAMSTCRSWRHEVDNSKQKSCALDTVVILGRTMEKKPSWDESVINSGWMMARIDETLMKDNCEVIDSP